MAVIVVGVVIVISLVTVTSLITVVGIIVGTVVKLVIRDVYVVL